MSNKISIALCTYNGEKYIKEQIESLINQTRKPDEIVVSDDNSSDKTIEIIKDVLANTGVDLVLNINKPGLGVFKNFEKAISLCSGDIIFPCDQDDIWKKEKIEKMINSFDEETLAVYCNAAVVLNDENHYLYPLWQPKDIDDKDNGTSSFNTLVYRGGSIAGCCMAFKKELYNKIKPFPDRVYHDDWLITCAVILGKVKAVNEELIYYRQHSDNVCGIIRGSKLSYYKSLFTNIRPYIEHREYIYDRHKLVYEALISHNLVDTSLKQRLNENLELCKDRALIRSLSWKENINNAKKDYRLGYYKKYAKGNHEYFKDLYDITVERIFMRNEKTNQE